MSVSVPCWRHCLSCRQLYFPSCQLTCAPPPSLFLSGISVFRAPFSVLRLPLHFIKVAARESQCQRRGRSNCSRTRLLSYCYNKFQLHFLGSFLSVPPPSSPLGHLLRQPDRPSASCSSASKYESPFVVPCSGCLSSSRAAVAMHLISSVHVVDFASPSKCLPCTPVLAQRLSLSATWPSYTNPTPGLPTVYPTPNFLSLWLPYYFSSAFCASSSFSPFPCHATQTIIYFNSSLIDIYALFSILRDALMITFPTTQ